MAEVDELFDTVKDSESFFAVVRDRERVNDSINVNVPVYYIYPLQRWITVLY